MCINCAFHASDVRTFTGTRRLFFADLGNNCYANADMLASFSLGARYTFSFMSILLPMWSPTCVVVWYSFSG
jgi:hypothetical protein